MQVFGNVATQPERLTTKSSGRVYWQMRVAESHRGLDGEAPTWYTVRVLKDTIPELSKGDFVKVTGKLKTDFYLSREGKPTGTLLILAFEAAKIAKPAREASEPLQSSAARKEPSVDHPVATAGKDDWVD
jgi:single-stranded DNA-binding protein